MQSNSTKPTKRIALVGEIGAGKSKLGNIIGNSQLFIEYNTQKSGTQRAEKKKVITDEFDIEIYDTCGFEDNRGKSRTAILREIFVLIQDCRQGIDLVIYCLKATDKMKIERIKELGMIFGDGVFSNLAIVRTKVDMLDEQARQDFLTEGKDEMISILNEDDVLTAVKENQLLFSDPKNSKEDFLRSFKELLMAKEPYIHPLSNINFLQLSSYESCIKIPEFVNLIRFNIHDLEKEIHSLLEGIKKLDKKKSETSDLEKIAKIDEKLTKNREKLSQLENECEELKELQNVRLFLLEFEARENFHAAFNTYVNSLEENSLDRDMREICSAWDEIYGPGYKLKGSFQKDILAEIQNKLPRKLKDRIVVILQRELGAVLNDLSMELTENNPLSEFVTLGTSGLGIASGVIARQAIAEGIIIGLGETILAAAAGIVLTVVGVILAALEIRDILTWERAPTIDELVIRLRPQIAYKVLEKISTNVNKAIREGLKNYARNFSR